MRPGEFVEAIGQYNHAPSREGGVPLWHVVFDQINRPMSAENAPLWFPLPILTLGNETAYHICSVENLQHLMGNEGQFQLAASLHPNVKRMQGGIKGISSGGGVLVKVQGPVNAAFDADVASVVSGGRRWLQGRHILPDDVKSAIFDLRGRALQHLIKLMGGENTPWRTWEQVTIGRACNDPMAWTYWVGAFWDRNNAPPEFLDWYTSELDRLISAADLSQRLSQPTSGRLGRAIHDELIFAPGWSIIEITPTTTAAKQQLRQLGISFSATPFRRVKDDFGWSN
jgi:hypothetical protein